MLTVVNIEVKRIELVIDCPVAFKIFTHVILRVGHLNESNNNKRGGVLFTVLFHKGAVNTVLSKVKRKIDFFKLIFIICRLENLSQPPMPSRFSL